MPEPKIHWLIQYKCPSCPDIHHGLCGGIDEAIRAAGKIAMGGGTDLEIIQLQELGRATVKPLIYGEGDPVPEADIHMDEEGGEPVLYEMPGTNTKH